LWYNVQKYCYSRTRHRWQYGGCALRAGYLKLLIHPEYVTLIALRLHERALMSPYTCIVCLALCCSLILHWDLYFSVVLLSFAGYRFFQDIFCIRLYFLTLLYCGWGHLLYRVYREKLPECALDLSPPSNSKLTNMWNIPIYVQQDATLYSLFISGNCSTCFGW
jgi:hypothetical protein